jgi:predicted Zn-dependent protease
MSSRRRLLTTLPAIALGVVLLASPRLAADATENLSTYARGIYAERAGETGVARRHFEATLAADPDSFEVASKTARTQFADEDLAAASGTLRHYAQDHRNHLPSQLHYADFLKEQAPADAVAQKVAIETLKTANLNFPHTVGVFSRLINLYENAERSEESLALLKAQFEAPEAGPYHWMALAPIARTLLPGDSPELPGRLDLIAAKTAETGIAIPRAARTVSDYYRSTGRLGQAITTLEDHLAAAPSSLDLRTRLGLLLLAAKREGEAEAHLLETLAIDPDQAIAHRALAKYYERSGKPDQSLHHAAEALKITGGHPGEFLDLANRFLDNDEPHPARLLLEKARFEHPDDPGIVARLAIATLRDGNTSGAARLFRQAEALARDSDDPDAKAFLDADFQLEFAGSLREAGDLPAAESRLAQAARSFPADQPLDTARALRELARLWLDQDKNHSPAASLLKRAESLDPDNPETKALLERAKGE